MTFLAEAHRLSSAAASTPSFLHASSALNTTPSLRAFSHGTPNASSNFFAGTGMSLGFISVALLAMA